MGKRQSMTHIWDGSDIVMELDGSEAIVSKYTRGINLIAVQDGTGVNRAYYLFNGHGDIVQLTQTTGDILTTYDYDAFGNEKNPPVGDANPFRYCGEYQDLETNTYYLRARNYDPATGRFFSEDTNKGKATDPLSLNLYTYCGNNPVNYVDPSGHLTEWAEKGLRFMEQVYEKYPGFIKNTSSTLTSYGNRIPDFLNNKVVGEIKNVSYQYLSSQIKGFIEIAQKADKQFVLVVNGATKLSAPLIAEIQKVGGIIIRFGEGIGKGANMVPLFIDEKLLRDMMKQLYPDNLTALGKENSTRCNLAM